MGYKGKVIQEVQQPVFEDKTKNILFFYFLNMANSQHTFMKKK